MSPVAERENQAYFAVTGVMALNDSPDHDPVIYIHYANKACKKQFALSLNIVLCGTVHIYIGLNSPYSRYQLCIIMIISVDKFFVSVIHKILQTLV